METKETAVNTTKQESDSFGIKIMMAIIAVAVVVLTIINAVPLNAEGKESKTVTVSENVAVVSRSVQATHNAA